MTLVDVKNFSFSIEGNRILNNLSFSIEKGERVAVVGPNGAGKSTLLKCLNRIVVGGQGEIQIAGKPLRDYSQKQLAQRMAYVPQADGWVAPFTAGEFVSMSRYSFQHASSPGSRRQDEWVDAALEATQTQAFKNRLLGTLSGGERQKVFMAGALAQQADILLLDEPTSFLDPRHAADINALIHHMGKTNNTTLITVTHDINTAVLSSQRILALKEGQVAYWGEAKKFMDPDLLQKIYETSFTFMTHPLSQDTLVAPDIARC